MKIDYVGFALIALGLGLLQVVLDKGQREDWFQTTYITVFSIIVAVSLTAAVLWELHVKEPIVNLRLFKDRNFSMSNMMIFVLGFVLFGTTVLLPQYAQELMGYSAEQSGLVISPGGLMIMLLMPMIGFMVSRYDARKIISFGFAIVGISMFSMMRFNLSVDFRTMMWARVFQASGVAFLFIPINTAAYASIPREKSNAASGLINLSRNIGASVGISFVTTMLARREQFHQAALVNHITNYQPRVTQLIQGMAHGFMDKGASALAATAKAYGVIGSMVARQATLLSYLDNFYLMGVCSLAMIPFVFLMKKAKTGGPIAVH